MLRGILSVLAVMALFAHPAAAQSGDFTSPDEVALIDRMEHIATDLPEKGWDAYADYFSADYDNWVMRSERITGRAAFMEAVRAWRDAGNGASKVEVTPLSIDFLGDGFAYVRSHNKEWFFGPAAEAGRERFEGYFASVWKKEDDGVWRVYRSSFIPVAITD